MKVSIWNDFENGKNGDKEITLFSVFSVQNLSVKTDVSFDLFYVAANSSPTDRQVTAIYDFGLWEFLLFYNLFKLGRFNWNTGSKVESMYLGCIDRTNRQAKIVFLSVELKPNSRTTIQFELILILFKNCQFTGELIPSQNHFDFSVLLKQLLGTAISYLS